MGFSIFFTIMKHQKVITVNDGWDAVCNCDNGATFEFGAQSVLDESIGSTVNWSSCLIKHKNMPFLQQRTP